jgi:enamine deaminase RidA (YjgF/YER057c/UK114 family)
MVPTIDFKKAIAQISRSRQVRHGVGAAIVVAAVSLASCTEMAPPPKPMITRTGSPTSTIAATVSVPAAAKVIYLSGGGGMLPMPPGSPPGAPRPDSGDMEVQATRALETIKTKLQEQGYDMGDVVMMHAFMQPEAATGRGDAAGWNAAFKKFFGTPEQPNKPSRTSITLPVGGTPSPSKIEIEVIAAKVF